MYENLKQPNFDVLCRIDDVLLLFFRKIVFFVLKEQKKQVKNY